MPCRCDIEKPDENPNVYDLPYEMLNAPSREPIRRHRKRPGRLVRAFGHSTAVHVPPVYARAVAGVH